MAKTITQAGGNPYIGNTSTSTAVSNARDITPTPTQEGDKLAGDLLKVMGNISSLAQTHYTASVEAAKRVASDRANQFSKKVLELEAIINENPSDKELYNQAQQEIEQTYLELSNATFDLEDAQVAFDKNFTEPTAIAEAKTKLKWRDKELDLIDAELIQQEKETVRNLTQANTPVTPETFDVATDATSQRSQDKKQAQNTLLDGIIDGFSAKYATKERMGEFDIYKEDKVTFDQAKIDKAWNDNFSAIGTMKDGKLTVRDGVDPQVAKKAQDYFDSYIKKHQASKKSMTVVSAIPQTEENITLNGSTSFDEAVRRTESIQKELDVLKKAGLEGNNQYTRLKMHLDKAKAKAKFLGMMEYETNRFLNGDITYEEFIENANKLQWEATLEGTAGKQPYAVRIEKGGAEKYLKRAVKKMEVRSQKETYDKTLESGVNIYAKLGQLKKETGNIKSDYWENTTKEFNKTGVIKADNFDQFASEYKKRIDYMNASGSLDGNKFLSSKNRQEITDYLDQLQADVENGRITQEQALEKAQNFVEGLRWNSMAIKAEDVNNYKNVNKAINEMDANDVAGYGWLDIEIGPKQFSTGFQKIIADDYNSDALAPTDSTDRVKEYIGERGIVVRSGKGLLGHSSVWNKGFVMYRSRGYSYSGDTVAKVVEAKIKQRFGGSDKYANIAKDGNIDMFQSRDSDGNVITTVVIRLQSDATPIATLTLTEEEFKAGQFDTTKEAKPEEY